MASAANSTSGLRSPAGRPGPVGRDLELAPVLLDADGPEALALGPSASAQPRHDGLGLVGAGVGGQADVGVVGQRLARAAGRGRRRPRGRAGARRRRSARRGADVGQHRLEHRPQRLEGIDTAQPSSWEAAAALRRGAALGDGADHGGAGAARGRWLGTDVDTGHGPEAGGGGARERRRGRSRPRGRRRSRRPAGKARSSAAVRGPRSRRRRG